MSFPAIVTVLLKWFFPFGLIIFSRSFSVRCQILSDSQIIINDDVVFMRINVINSMWIDAEPDTLMVELEIDKTHRYLISDTTFYPSEWSHQYDLELGTVTKILWKDIIIDSSSQKTVPEISEIILGNPQETIIDENGRIIKECYDINCEHACYYTYRPDGTLELETFIGSNRNIRYKQIYEYDTLNNLISRKSLKNDSTISHTCFEYVPGTQLISRFANMLKDNDSLTGNTIYVNHYEFDKKGNWTKRTTFYLDRQVEVVRRRIYYEGEVSNGQRDLFDAYSVCDFYETEIQFDKYQIVYDCNNHSISNISNGGKQKWKFKLKKLSIDLLIDVRKSNFEKYDISILSENHEKYLLNSRNGRVIKYEKFIERFY
ncbi:MAG: hypothetical protein QNK23_05220 [Crocinitomicaceae bacterium]|nr:hypothetical protein [Crocinitomicaceae bacterium]